MSKIKDLFRTTIEESVFVRENEIRQFLKHIKEDKNGCIIWVGSDENGYGRFFFDGRKERAHRWSYKNYYGKITKGLVLDHLCQNKKCVNPLHLEEVTDRVNILRGNGVTASNFRKKTCINGHVFDEKNTRIEKIGRRTCRKCKVIVHRKWYQKRKEDPSWVLKEKEKRRERYLREKYLKKEASFDNRD